MTPSQREYMAASSADSIYNNPSHLHHQHQRGDHHAHHLHQPHVVHGPAHLMMPGDLRGQQERMPTDGYNDPVYINRSMRASDHKMLVNVGGVRHEILWITLEKFPNTRLGRLQECRTEDSILNFCDFYSYDDNEYFFDKNPRIFNAVLSCYRTGKLHLPDEFCLTELVTELRYWGFDENYLDLCCQQKYKGRKLMYQEMRSEAESELFQQYNYQLGLSGMSGVGGYDPSSMMYDERFGVGQCAAYRKFLWDSYENPRYSKTTKVLPMISIIFSILAVIAVALNSVDSIKERNSKGQVMDNVLLTRLIMVCVAWISLEYILRLFSSPNVTRFLFDGCNIIDLLGCGLYFYTLLQQSSKPIDRINDLWKLYLMLRSWRVPNMICKLLYEPQTLKMDAETLSNFNKQFGILMLFFLTGVVMFSTAIFTAEKDDPKTPFASIPETFWYTIATLTTAGNSVHQPSTTWGKYFGALCSIVGVLFLASVITISNFARVLQNISNSRNPSLLGQHGLMPQTGQSAYNATYPANAASILKKQIPMLNQQQSTSLLQQQQQFPGTYPGRGASHHRGQQLPSGGNIIRELNEANTSFHHITFSDDLANALGTIDVLVERDRVTKSLRDTQSSSNKVKGITLKIKFDPLTRMSMTRDTMMMNANSSTIRGGGMISGVDNMKQTASSKLTGVSSSLGGQVPNQSVVGSTTATGPSSNTANDRALPALV